MKSINEYLLSKTNKTLITYEVKKGSETFDTKVATRYESADFGSNFKRWFFKELKDSELLNEDELKRFKKTVDINWWQDESHITDAEDANTGNSILTNIKPDQYTYKDIFEIFVNYYKLNKKNLKFV